METLWTITPSFTPSITFSPFISKEQMYIGALCFLGGVVTAGGSDSGLIQGVMFKLDRVNLLTWDNTECILCLTCCMMSQSHRMAEKVLVTGGAGYIGSHCVVELIEAGYQPVVVDNYSNAVRGEGNVAESIRRIEKLLNTSIEFHELDLLDRPALEKLFNKHSFSAVMHFAGLKAVGESVEQPLRYYRVNLTASMNLMEVMQAHKVHNLVFSSSATVYGDPQHLPIDEQHPVGACTNPYGKTKYFIEEMIKDHCKSEKVLIGALKESQTCTVAPCRKITVASCVQNWNAVLLRYFNPIGAHASGQIGEDPQGIPNNLMPYVAQVAVGRRPFLNVFGNDYETVDGTGKNRGYKLNIQNDATFSLFVVGVRDYIHVVDLAKGHIAALKKLKDNCGCQVYNLGTGRGYSVLQMVKYKIAPRREGDIASCYADPRLAEKELGWTAAFDLERMCEDLWRWQSMNPTGFTNGVPS
ncbi:hypothetical protein CCH79_00004647 [Gambusia affinis]|uniref:UDP-N-acetylglucosamine 4-epimerase n=1 Tax=Gambusia affinis TaxID=33528 RepID=A0A315UXS8_GAMAF|nr:hypothetical protein CCH79_00004647 [Gambusia affinis]